MYLNNLAFDQIAFLAFYRTEPQAGHFGLGFPLNASLSVNLTSSIYSFLWVDRVRISVRERLKWNVCVRVQLV